MLGEAYRCLFAENILFLRYTPNVVTMVGIAEGDNNTPHHNHQQRQCPRHATSHPRSLLDKGEGERGEGPGLQGISAILHWLPFLFGDLSESLAGRKEVSPFEVMCA